MKTAISAILTLIIVFVGVLCDGRALHVYDKSIWLYLICVATGTYLIAIPAGKYWYNLIKSKL